MLDGKYPSNTSKIIQQSLLLLLSSALSLISPTQGFSCSRFICLYLRLYGTTLMLTLSLFTEIGFRGCFIHRGIDFNACLFFPHPLLLLSSPGKRHTERRIGERRCRRRREKRRRGSSGLYLHYRGLVVVVVVVLWPGQLLKNPNRFPSFLSLLSLCDDRKH